MDGIVVLTYQATKAGVTDYTIGKFVRVYRDGPSLILGTGHRIGSINHRNEIDRTVGNPELSSDDIQMLLENLTEYSGQHMYGSIEWVTRSTAAGRFETAVLPGSHKKAFFRDSMHRLKAGEISTSPELSRYFAHFCAIEGELAGIKFPADDQPQKIPEYTPESDYRARISEFE